MLLRHLVFIGIGWFTNIMKLDNMNNLQMLPKEYLIMKIEMLSKENESHTNEVEKNEVYINESEE